MIPVRFLLDVKTPNPSNGHSAASRMAASGLRKKQRQVAHREAISMLRAIGLPTRMVWIKPRMAKGRVVRPGFEIEVVDLPAARWVVDVVRLSAGRLDDHDNLRSALKGIVDGLADALHVNDGDRSRVQWRPDQRRAPPHTHAVEVEISQFNPQHQEQTR